MFKKKKTTLLFLPYFFPVVQGQLDKSKLETALKKESISPVGGSALMSRNTSKPLWFGWMH